ncbi:unnamed protein product [Rhizophagus irregularis]|nr:unnamed protein product [Rhizophagus irregularis]
MRLFDEDSKSGKGEIITWNENESDVNDKVVSPRLTKCKGCERNIRKKNAQDETCIIYDNNSKSSVIKRRMD